MEDKPTLLSCLRTTTTTPYNIIPSNNKRFISLIIFLSAFKSTKCLYFARILLSCCYSAPSCRIYSKCKQCMRRFSMENKGNKELNPPISTFTKKKASYLVCHTDKKSDQRIGVCSFSMGFFVRPLYILHITIRTTKKK